MRAEESVPKTIDEAGEKFTEELLRRFHHDRPDEGENPDEVTI